MPGSIDCAAALVLAGEEVLLGLRAPDRRSYPNTWDLFGGHVEAGESVEEALVRELEEEIDITPTDYSFIKTVLKPYRDGPCTYGYHIHRVTGWAGPGPRLRAPEHSEIQWFTRLQALTLDLALPEYRDLLVDHLA